MIMLKSLPMYFFYIFRLKEPNLMVRPQEYDQPLSAETKNLICKPGDLIECIKLEFFYIIQIFFFKELNHFFLSFLDIGHFCLKI